jgi:hypothetical protein
MTRRDHNRDAFGASRPSKSEDTIMPLLGNPKMRIPDGVIEIEKDYVTVKSGFTTRLRVQRSKIETVVMRGRETLVLIGSGTELGEIHVGSLMAGNIQSWLVRHLRLR